MSGDNYLDARRRRILELLRGDRFVSLQSLDNISLDNILRAALREMPDNIINFALAYEPKQRDELSDSKFERLEGKVDVISHEVKAIKSLLYSKEEKKEEAILEFKTLASEIEGVLLVYCQYTPEGISIWTLIDTGNISDTLSKIVQVQIEIDNKYPNVFFDFLIDPLINKNELDTENWNPLFRRDE